VAGLIALLLTTPTFALEKPSKDAAIQHVLASLVKSSQEIKKTNGLGSLKHLTGPELKIWESPGVCLYPMHTFKRDDLSKAGDDASSLRENLESIQSGPLTVWPDPKGFEYTKKDDCAIKPRWAGRWVFYPGDFMTDHNLICEDQKGAPISEAALIYFDESSLVVFALKKLEGEWKIIAIAGEEACYG